MEFTYYGHACFALHAEGKTLLIDPFISGNEKAKHIDINHIQADYIAISHGHADHIADAEAIALRTGALVICAYEIHDWLQTKGIHRTHPMNTGGSHTFGPFTIKCTVAQHSSCLPDGSYGGNPLGFLIQTNQHNVYYSGDTALTFDMQLIPMWAKLNAAILPIGDNFTMGYSDARIATQWCGAPKTIGVHFDTFPPITINHEEAKAHFNTHQLELILPTIGETISIN
jgi:L-ascorbate metabolism protein UlaG (beta-lactamase superfamily)